MKNSLLFFCISSIFHEFWVRHILLMRFPTPRNTIHPVQPYPKSWESQKTSGWISSLIQFDTWLFVRTAFWCRSLVFAALRLKNQVFQPNPNFSQDVEVRGILYIYNIYIYNYIYYTHIYIAHIYIYICIIIRFRLRVRSVAPRPD